MVSLLPLLLLVGGAVWYFYRVGEPRRTAIQPVIALSKALASLDADCLAHVISMPVAIRDSTAQEQFEFLSKALRDEVSVEGSIVLQRKGDFGALTNLFPEEGIRWATQAGVDFNNCMAFKMERDGIRAEVVLVREGETYRVVRCNNVKQLAGKL